jgi:group I intron endonuclease
MNMGVALKKIAVYRIRNIVSGKFYIGSSSNLYERWRTHRQQLRSGKHSNHHLQASWLKHGEEAFKFEILEEFFCAQKMLAYEEALITKHITNPLCMNLTMWVETPMRGRTAEKHPRYGVKLSEEEKEVIRQHTTKQWQHSDPRTGKTHSEETKERIRKAKLANPTRAWLGKTRDEETRKKIGDTQRGVKKEPRQFTEEGLRRAQENMRRVAMAHPQKVKAFDAVLAKFSQEVQDKYDFTNAEYTGASNRIERCLCPTHGLFSQYAAQFRKGRGCPSCGADDRAESKRKQMKEAWATEEGRKTFLENRPSKTRVQ